MSAQQKVLIFDFDGTIADTLPLYLDILYKGRTSSKTTITDEKMAQLRRAPLVRLVGHLDVPPFSRVRILWVRWRHLHRRVGEAKPFGDMHKIMTRLHKEGYKLFVLSTNYERNVRAFLRAQKLDKYFSGVYHCGVFFKARGLRQIVASHGLDRKSTYYIANEPLDMRSARKAGVRGVAVSWSGQDKEVLAAEHPEVVLDVPDELLKLFPINAKK